MNRKELRELSKEMKRDLNAIVGYNIRLEREVRNLTREELAEITDLTTSHLGLIERGHRGATVVTLTKMSKVFQKPIDI